MDQDLREVLAEIRGGQAAMSAAATAMHLETSGRLTRLEERVERALEDVDDHDERLRKLESGVSVAWMRKVEELAERNAEQVQDLKQQRGFLVGAAATAGYLMSVLEKWWPHLTAGK